MEEVIEGYQNIKIAVERVAQEKIATKQEIQQESRVMLQEAEAAAQAELERRAGIAKMMDCLIV